MSILFTGDVILDRGVQDQMRLHGDSLLTNALQKVKSKDFFIINYEGTFTSSDSSQDDIFNFKVDNEKATLLYKNGVTHVSIANNHSYDYSEDGFKDTLKTLKRCNLGILGDTCEPKILTKGKYSCAVLSASLTIHNEALCISSIEKLKNSVTSFVINNPSIPLIIYIHWGLELQPTPEKWQRELAKELVNLGVDGIVGHHPHVVQTIEFINDVPVFYSLGNYLADAYLPNTNCSYTLEFKITDKIQNINIKPIKIERYFPSFVDKEHQFSDIRKYISISNGVCAMQMKDGWMLKPLKEVDFKEETTLWVSSVDKKITAIKRLQSGNDLLTVYNPNDQPSTIRLHGDLSEMQFSDINNDGTIDILLGISKKVNFDPVKKKRINIYSYKNEILQPLWLGTKFIDDVKDFDIYSMEGINYLTTIEIDEKGKKHQRMYEWDDFGFALTTTNQIKANEN
ncbi:capsule synthesis protein PGA_cap [Aquimarina sp. MAR_2010_214]|uniref:CapA family protein n=1 Tax=Aquimarina sp. MAR_2010_214 TaxID=1250026 RepID=UPI000CB425C7|nr:CapA family protein [Aquimarina sp. MAR_2010_214]PKV51357.1 capsule synthesis protein PGA_cap [Aquimarina sp. MAR_2010_214]